MVNNIGSPTVRSPFFSRIFLIRLYSLLITAVAVIYIVLRPHNQPAVLFDEFTDYNNGFPSSEFIVPNIVHFLRFGTEPVTFIDAVCIIAAWKHQKPDLIFVHTDQHYLNGPYWDVVKSEVGENVVTVHREKPTTVFGKPLSTKWLNFHAADIARLHILMEYGGIFLDNDSYIVKCLDEFRRYEMTMGWQHNGNMSNQVVIAHRNARFLKLWMESYKDYRSGEWYWNAGQKPTKIWLERPHLVNRVTRYLAEWDGTSNMIYLEKSNAWRNHYAIHLMIRHTGWTLARNLTRTATYPVNFTERNILEYEVNIKYMALEVYPFNRTRI